MTRRLTADELELWRAVTATIRPRDARKAMLSAPPEHRPSPILEHRPRAESPPRPKSPLRHLGTIDRREQRDLSRGRLQIDARIDLHGRRVADAHQAVHDFLCRAQSAGARVVLIVTGKGGGTMKSDGEIGVLRRQAPLWLSDPRLRQVVAAFGEAAQPHGGAGALYVRLRKR